MTERTVKPTFFEKAADFGKWLKKNHNKETELLVGFYKTNSGRPSMTWPESVDEALCYGWIDAVRRSIDEESYSIRFTHRKPASIWSKINIEKAEKLIKEGRMQPEGLAAYEKRKGHKSQIYSYENQPAELTKEYEKQLRANKAAWDFFSAQAPSYRKTAIYHLMSAKQEGTRQNRLERLITSSAAGQKIKELNYNKKK